MGILLRRRRSEKAAGATTQRALVRSSCPPTTMSPTAGILKKEVRVRAKSICNSSNLDQLHYERQSSSADGAREDPWSEKNVQEAIDLWELTEEQVDQLRQHQHNLKDCAFHFKYDPHIILRYMTSPKGADTEVLFRKMIQWRLENNIDNKLQEYTPNQILLDYNPTAILKDYDKEGDPIYVERGGNTDAPGMLKRFTREELMEYTIYTRELNTQGAWINEYHRRQGRKVKAVTVVYDLKGLNTKHLNPTVLDFFKEVQVMNQEKYPGPIKRMIIIRAPSIFRYIWAVAKHFFPQSSRDKMIFAGKHHHKVLEKYIDLEVLPSCIYEHGKGAAAAGLPPRMEGGIIPDHVQRVDHDVTSPSAKSFMTLDSFDRTEQGSLASGAASDSDTSFTSLR